MSNGEQEIRLIGLFGYPVEHSLSPAMHNAAFQALGLPFKYVPVKTPPEELPARVEQCVQEGFAGWNITVPHKQSIIPLLNEMSDEVLAIGACNTVKVRNGQLMGFNTDTLGFVGGLREAGGIGESAKAVLLGAGGSCRAVAWALARTGHDLLILSRKPEQAAQLACALQEHVPARIEHGPLDTITINRALRDAELLVNCTPAGQHPNVDETPLPWGTTLPEHLLVYDLVYNPRPSKLLREAAQAGCRTQDGLSMLLYQGAASFEIWTGQVAPVDVMRQALVPVTIDQGSATGEPGAAAP